MSNIPLVPDEMLDEMLLFFGMAKAAILTRMHVNSVCVGVCAYMCVCVSVCLCLCVRRWFYKSYLTTMHANRECVSGYCTVQVISNASGYLVRI